MLSSVFLFFEFTAPEIMLILFVTLLLFGGDKLPGLAKGLGKGIRDFKEASEGVKREINNQIDNYDKKKEDEPAKTAEETPLIAEHSTDNPDGTAPENHVENHVENTMQFGESHAAGTDHVDFEHPADHHHAEENHDHAVHVSEADKAHK